MSPTYRRSVYMEKGFPKDVAPNTLLACVFWAVLYNVRTLTPREQGKIVPAALRHGFMRKAPLDETGVQVCQHYGTKKIQQSKAGVYVTPKGVRYWMVSIRPNIPVGVVLGYAQKYVPRLLSKKYSIEELARRRKR